MQHYQDAIAMVTELMLNACIRETAMKNTDYSEVDLEDLNYTVKEREE